MKNKLVLAILFCILLLLILLLFLLFPLPKPTKAVVQDPGFRLAETTKMWFPKRVTVSDGFVFRYSLWDKYDTAIYYMTGSDTFDVVTTFKKHVPNKPPLPDIVTTIDDNAVGGGQAYSPTTNAGDNIYITTGWSHFKGQTWNAAHNNNTYSFVDAVELAYVELTCTCYKIEWWTEKRENHGIASVQLFKQDGDNWVPDGVPYDVDQYDPRTDNNSLLVWTSPNMTNALHRYRISYTGRKNPSSKSANIGHDKFVIYKKQ